MKAEHKKALRICSCFIFGVYIILLLYFLFFAESTGRTYEGRAYHYNLSLFKEIKRFWNYRESLGISVVMLNLFGNVMAFVPFGMILPIMHRRYRSLLHIILLSFEFSFLVEIIQLVFKVGCFDVDDLLLNTIGGMLGYVFFALLNRVRCRFEVRRK